MGSPNRTVQRTFATAAVIALTAAGAGLASSTPAAALDWHCKTSSRTLDDPGYSGPWPDNRKFTVKACAAWGSQGIYAKTKVTWDGPSPAYDAFDDARSRVYLKRSEVGKDPVVRYKTFSINKIQDDANSSYTSAAIGKRTNGGPYLRADAALKLNWDNDGAGTKHYGFTASPTV